MDFYVYNRKYAVNFILILILLLLLSFSVSANNDESQSNYIWYDTFEDGSLSDYTQSGGWIIEDGWLKSGSGGNIHITQPMNYTTTDSISISYDLYLPSDASFGDFLRSKTGQWGVTTQSLWTRYRDYQDVHNFYKDSNSVQLFSLGCGSQFIAGVEIENYCEYQTGTTIRAFINGVPCSSAQNMFESYEGRTIWGWGNFVSTGFRVDNIKIWNGSDCSNPPNVIYPEEEWSADYETNDVLEATTDTIVKFILAFSLFISVLIIGMIGTYLVKVIKK